MLHHVGRVAKVPLSLEFMFRSAAGLAWVRRVHENTGQQGKRKYVQDQSVMCVEVILGQMHGS
jgi:hypothetical protein